MDAITYALHAVYRSDIPERLLKLAFIDRSSRFGINESLDSLITNIIIKGIVLKDLNITGGETLRIPLDKCSVSTYQVDQITTNLVIRVPYKETGNRDIIEPISLFTLSGDNRTNVNNSLLSTAEKLYNRFNNSSGELITTNLELIASNTILVFDNITVTGNMYLKVKIEYDEYLSRLPKRLYFKFGELVITAVKMYIYQKLVLELDAGAIVSGHDFGRLTTVIESYADSFEKYEDLINNTWRKLSFMGDKEAYNNFLKNIINPSI